MVAQNLIFGRESILFIPNTSEQDWKNKTEIKKLGNNVSSSTEMEVLKTFLLLPILKHSTPNHSYITGIDHSDINILFKPLCLAQLFAHLLPPKFFMRIFSNIHISCTGDLSNSIKQQK